MAPDVHRIVDFSALLPLAIVFISMLALRTSAMMSSAIGIGAAVLVSIYADFDWQPRHVLRILGASGLLTMAVALVIVPGLSFNSLVRSHGVARRLAQWVQELPVSREAKTLLVVLGLAPAVESLTGFGVSLFLTVSIIYPLYPLRKTAQLGLLSMNIMPWGTLGMATVIGAMLIGGDAQKLGALTSLTSAAVYPYLGVAAACVVADEHRTRHVLLGFALGSLLALSLIVSSRLLNVEAAGVASGFFVCAVGLWILKDGVVQLRQGLVLLVPYASLLGLVLVQRITPGLHESLAEVWVLSVGDVSVSPLASPGILLALVTLMLLVHKPGHRINAKEVFRKSRKTLLGMWLFLVLSQILVQTGMLKVLATQTGKVLTVTQMVLASPSLGVLSGLITGSNVGGNALLIDLQHQLGRAIGASENLAGLLAALQNSGAGHAVFSSVPMILLLLGILRDESGGRAPAEHDVLRFTLQVIIGVVILLSAAGYALARVMGTL